LTVVGLLLLLLDVGVVGKMTIVNSLIFI